MLYHVMVGSNDIERSRRFYDAVLAVLGCPPAVTNEAATGHVRLFYRNAGSTFTVTQPINDQPATAANGGTVGFTCATPEAVLQFHDVAVAQGGTSIEEAPGPRGGGPVHLAYVRDPDGNKLCALYIP